ncbi:MAG TPA: UxaA family hydrolase [Bryobacteraceae bacterium]|nr:UxaA family hydrolase [Bryobacteraceae bacterium]
MKRCFQIDSRDNVATLLEDAEQGPVEVLGATRGGIEIAEPIEMGHKVALQAIAEGALVMKYGVPIGIAARAILRGEWVHLHNCRSQVDQRSSAFDPHSGAATDAVYE